jgi:UDP-glucose 4-epimerase
LGSAFHGILANFNQQSLNQDDMSDESGNRRRVLLIGGSGFVGSHVGDEFLAQGWEVTVFGRSLERFREPSPRITYIPGHLNEHSVLDGAIARNMDCVVHLVSSTYPSTSNADPAFDVRSNLVDTLAVLDSCVKHKVRKLMFASSGGTVYGVPKRLPISEDDPTNPICSYGIVKLALEKYLQLYHRLYGLEYVVLRISNPYGPRQDPTRIQGAVSVFAAKILESKPITIWGTGRVVRDFIHVQDLARLFVAAAVSRVTGVFNASSGIGVSLNDLIAIITDQFGMAAEVNRVAGRACDVPVAVLDCERAKTIFGWKPQISLERGIQGVRTWMLQEVLGAQSSLERLATAEEVENSGSEIFLNSKELEMPPPVPELALPATGSA